MGGCWPLVLGAQCGKNGGFAARGGCLGNFCMSKIRFRYKLLAAVLLVWAGSGLWQAGKPLPEGISAEFPWRPAAEVSFLADRTFVDGQGRRRSEQVIFDEILAMIGGAQRLVVADMFLFNDISGEEGGALRPLSEELTAALVRSEEH